jgi:hypothetical protein
VAKPDEHDDNRRITKDDLESKFRELAGDLDQTTAKMRNTAVAAGGAIFILLLILFFLLGRRRGAKKTTVVEIRRV